jgi:hypothetical protein
LHAERQRAHEQPPTRQEDELRALASADLLSRVTANIPIEVLREMVKGNWPAAEDYWDSIERAQDDMFGEGFENSPSWLQRAPWLGSRCRLSEWHEAAQRALSNRERELLKVEIRHMEARILKVQDEISRTAIAMSSPGVEGGLYAAAQRGQQADQLLQELRSELESLRRRSVEL